MLDFEMNDPNVLHSEEDYVMHPNAESIWITVAGVSVRIAQDAKGVLVEMFPRFGEVEPVIDEAEATFNAIKYTDIALGELWDEFDTAIDDEEKIEEPFLHFPEGTDRMVIWHWFDARFSEGLGKHLEGQANDN